MFVSSYLLHAFWKQIFFYAVLVKLIRHLYFSTKTRTKSLSLWFILHFIIKSCPQTRVSRVLQASERRGTECGGAANCRPAASSSSPHASALGGGSIPPPLSCLGIGFWYTFVPPSNGCSALYQYPFSPQKTVKRRRRSSAPLPQKISPKNFWKGDNICHVFCAIIETKENTHA